MTRRPASAQDSANHFIAEGVNQPEKPIMSGCPTRQLRDVSKTAALGGLLSEE